MTRLTRTEQAAYALYETAFRGFAAPHTVPAAWHDLTLATRETYLNRARTGRDGAHYSDQLSGRDQYPTSD